MTPVWDMAAGSGGGVGGGGQRAKEVQIRRCMLLGLQKAFRGVIPSALRVLGTAACIFQGLHKCSQHSPVRARITPLYGWVPKHCLNHPKLLDFRA